MSVRTKITGVLVCGVVAVALAALAFSRAVLTALVQETGMGGGEQSMLAVVALALTGSVALAVLLVACIAAVVAAELIATAEAGRFVVQLAVLLLVVLLLAIALAGFVMPFVMPVVRIG
ncbi:MAG TPA: hypothetical protein PKJ99_15965 [Thermoanaerobaculales bacterium]|nr:hypothetical protein [Thermoanaerobaculales bacterium]HPA82403.1 hypothetical protein [Thermoanaerobaculales bacterium]HQL30909.1 hypothetical protein [Thermoanaerobaculales bacterium]HQP44348.1 hypothetical protein [Thermoanaerobaculales bacterium]